MAPRAPSPAKVSASVVRASRPPKVASHVASVLSRSSAAWTVATWKVSAPCSCTT
jgi:hypothetical protein